MANMNLKVIIPASGKARISDFLPTKNGGNTVTKSTEVGNIYAQFMAFQNQGSNPMYIGDATTTATNGFELGVQGSQNAWTPINYGTYLSDWWVAGSPGDVLFVLYIQ